MEWITTGDHKILLQNQTLRVDSMLHWLKYVCFIFRIFSVPGKPRNVTIALIGNSIEVSWLPPNASNEEIDYYIISWRNGNGTFHLENSTSSPFVIPNLGKYDRNSYLGRAKCKPKLDRLNISLQYLIPVTPDI